MAPTGGAIDMSLSFRITTSRECRAPALFIASYAMPALIAPSPMTATMLRSSVACLAARALLPLALARSLRARCAAAAARFEVAATAMPSPAEIEVEECAAPNGSYSLSARRVKPDRPPPWRRVRMRSRRPVRILCG